MRWIVRRWHRVERSALAASYEERAANGSPTFIGDSCAGLRTLIMDGSVMAGETLCRMGATYPAGLEVTKQVYASVSGRGQAHKIDTVLDYLNGDTVQVGGEPQNRWVFAKRLFDSWYSQRELPSLRRYINNIYDLVIADTPSPLARALHDAERSSARLPRANEPTTIQTLINCADLHDRPTAEQLATAAIAAERQYGTTTPAFSGNDGFYCAGLPADMSPAVPTGPTPSHWRPRRCSCCRPVIQPHRGSGVVAWPTRSRGHVSSPTPVLST